MIYSSKEIKIEKSKDNIDILKVNRNGKYIYIGSKYNMMLQINKFISNLKEKTEKEDVLFIYGLGNETVIKMLAENINENKIVVFEPNLNLREYIENLLSLEKYSNVKIIFNNDEKFEKYIDVFEIHKMKMYSFLNYESVYDKEYNDFAKRVNTMIRNYLVDTNTRILFNQRWFEATLKNMKYIAKSTPVTSIKNKLKNQPAVIVSAGPSLAKNIKELKNTDKSLFVISGGRTLRPLKNNDIKADMMVVLDAGDISYDLVAEYMGTTNIPLLFYEKTNARILEEYTGKKYFMTQSDIIRKIVGCDVPDYICGGSVAHTMTKAAIELGCNPIIFIGQDLAFTDDKTHAEIAVCENDDVINKKDEGTDFYVKAIGGGVVRTSSLLNCFRTELEEIVKEHPEVRFINATEGGAVINGMEELTFKECVETFGVENADFNIFDSNEEELVSEENIKTVLCDLKKSVDRMLKHSERGLKLLDELELSYKLKNQNKFASIRKELDKIDDYIRKGCNNYKELESVIYPIIYVTVTMNNADEENDDDIVENVLHRNRFLYGGIIKELKKVLPVLEEVMPV